MLQRMHQKGQGGFTLVELMIVVAIIGILAAVAIPQFAQYRIRGFNSSALSDIRNLTTAQEAFFADWQRYAVTYNNTGGPLAAVAEDGALLDGPSSAAMVIAQFVTGTASHEELPLAIGNGVSMQADVDANAASYTAISKHLQGNTMYGADSDSTAIYRDQENLDPGQGSSDSAVGEQIADFLPAPVAQQDDFAEIPAPNPWAAQ
ncbi:prepilin-type N-terminal cleavage/methylation domain-containing protein [Desulfurivibrio dismutans]|uniref:prepilin-type N-terminal cleavage/methylation domain-containing protein n=1 Tax=Desulfurivibrio dismutans TaxID=1398908 RepID=UPI0023D9E9E6|nr:prepilin-type N-terminal cleavage/methylation domain-containing protein [Desulfurivibrio alkaliphilus]MDF1615698.1 prepilin-type N-terminal cleavage/methylation domain-containing protein [Desulfurivibrio alkaliphilus]